jgi:hypothetical protein
MTDVVHYPDAGLTLRSPTADTASSPTPGGASSPHTTGEPDRRRPDMTDFTYAVDADGVAVITWDVPGKSMNVLTREAFALVEAISTGRSPIRP